MNQNLAPASDTTTPRAKKRTKVTELLAFSPESDGACLLGRRWLCAGGSLLFVGPSGVGKSSLVTQLILHWALGKPIFGLIPKRPLKTLVVQAENDTGDLAEIFQGVVQGLNLTQAEIARLDENLILERNDSQSGEALVTELRQLVAEIKPDIVLLDPLLSFIGDDIAKQAVCSQFLRSWLNPISAQHGCVWICVHHTGKPTTESKTRSRWKSSDFTYAGLGSSELVNWARAVMVLRQCGESEFELKFNKRGIRSGATQLDGSPTRSVWLKHAEKGICWEQMHPQEAESAPRGYFKAGPEVTNKVEEIAEMDLATFLEGFPPGGLSGRSCSGRLGGWLANQQIDLSLSTCRRAVERLVTAGILTKRHYRYYRALPLGD